MMNNCKARRARKHLQGFTLIEMAMVLVIIGLVMGSVLGALGSQLEQKKVRDTQERIKEASEAIMAFTISHGRLPCPASLDSKGDEQPVTSITSGRCDAFKDAHAHGYVPARTLGLGERGLNGVMQDGWGFGIRYAVTQVTGVEGGTCGSTCYPFTKKDGIKDAYYSSDPRTVPPPESLLQVCASSTAAAATTCGGSGKPPADLVAQPAFIVWSTARNGAPSAVNGADEGENLDGDRFYVSRSRTEINPDTSANTDATNKAFDDILQWRTWERVYQDMNNMGLFK